MSLGPKNCECILNHLTYRLLLLKIFYPSSSVLSCYFLLFFLGGVGGAPQPNVGLGQKHHHTKLALNKVKVQLQLVSSTFNDHHFKNP